MRMKKGKIIEYNKQNKKKSVQHIKRLFQKYWFIRVHSDVSVRSLFYPLSICISLHLNRIERCRPELDLAEQSTAQKKERVGGLAWPFNVRSFIWHEFFARCPCALGSISSYAFHYSGLSANIAYTQPMKMMTINHLSII